MRQLLYVSQSVVPLEGSLVAAILEQSRHNNALDGVTGLLWSDGTRFAQVVEGDDAAIADLLNRLYADPRHCDIVILHDRRVEERQFGSWSMEARTADVAADDYDNRMRRALDEASEAVRTVFATLIPTDAAAVIS